MTFEEIFYEPGLYVADSFHEGVAFRIDGDGELRLLTYQNKNDLMPSIDNPVIYKGLFKKNYRKVLLVKNLFKEEKKPIKIDSKSKFSFKTVKPTGRYSSFYPTHHYIKFKGIQCGSISDSHPFSIRLQVYKDTPDDNPNCDWKWITLKKESSSVEEAKEWLNQNIKQIFEKYHIRLEN